MLLFTQFTMLKAVYTGRQYDARFQNHKTLLVTTEQSFSFLIFGTYQLFNPICRVYQIFLKTKQLLGDLSEILRVGFFTQ